MGKRSKIKAAQRKGKSERQARKVIAGITIALIALAILIMLSSTLMSCIVIGS
jgi:hypothetical protein